MLEEVVQWQQRRIWRRRRSVVPGVMPLRNECFFTLFLAGALTVLSVAPGGMPLRNNCFFTLFLAGALSVLEGVISRSDRLNTEEIIGGQNQKVLDAQCNRKRQ